MRATLSTAKEIGVAEVVQAALKKLNTFQNLDAAGLLGIFHFLFSILDSGKHSSFCAVGQRFGFGRRANSNRLDVNECVFRLRMSNESLFSDQLSKRFG